MADSNAKLLEAVAFFEQILQTIPGDRTSLESLAVAYEKLGQHSRRRDCLIALVGTLLAENDLRSAQAIAETLQAYADHPPAAQAIARVAVVAEASLSRSRPVQRIRRAEPRAVERAAPVIHAFQDATLEYQAIAQAASSAEMELVWFWRDHDLVAEEICLDILPALTELPAAAQPALISALALLDDLHSNLTDIVLDKLQEVSGMPLLPLEIFEPDVRTASLLPAVFSKVRGVLPFAFMHNEVLVALLNPLSRELQDEVRARLEHPCHFYLVYPRTWLETAAKLEALASSRDNA